MLLYRRIRVRSMNCQILNCCSDDVIQTSTRARLVMAATVPSCVAAIGSLICSLTNRIVWSLW